MESTVGTDDDILRRFFVDSAAKRAKAWSTLNGHGCRRSQSKKTCIGLLKRQASKIKEERQTVTDTS